jgi:hypothetical protein
LMARLLTVAMARHMSQTAAEPTVDRRNLIAEMQSPTTNLASSTFSEDQLRGNCETAAELARRQSVATLGR